MPARVLTDPSQDFPRWYQDVVAKAELADNGPVRGTMVIRPYGYSIWEQMQSQLDARIKDTGAQNAYFPLFIPESYLTREAEHVEGFSPELAVVTHAGGKQLDEPVVVRPTSETMVGEYLAKWVNSYRDLPLLLNQWANVVRWELRPRMFLRTTEFLWQEGHTAHASQADAAAYASRIHREVYQRFMEQVLAIPVIAGRKTPAERFAGAINTMTLEAMMGDAKALQMGTSHELGQNFARAFSIDYLSDQGSQELCWTTSWGATTRMIGGLIMTHGDEQGMRLPPRLAPIQAQVMVVKPGEGVTETATALVGELRAAGVRVQLDDRTSTPFGRRAVDAELKGIPLRIELGPRDLAAGQVMLADRIADTKTSHPVTGLVATVVTALAQGQQALFDQALAHRERHTSQVNSIDEAIEAAQTGFARLAWNAIGPQGEQQLAAKAITVRCLVRPDGEVPTSDDEPGMVAILARSY